jgi:hypothetical protein
MINSSINKRKPRPGCKQVGKFQGLDLELLQDQLQVQQPQVKMCQQKLRKILMKLKILRMPLQSISKLKITCKLAINIIKLLM